MTPPHRPEGTNLFEGHLVSVRVHGGQQVDASVFDQADDTLVSELVLATHELHQVEKELATQDLVPVHPCNVAELRFPCDRHTTQWRNPTSFSSHYTNLQMRVFGM